MINITEAKKKIYGLAIERWGEELQIGMFHEEVAELIKAVNKYRRNVTVFNRRNVMEEIADVMIMIEQLCVLFDLSATEITVKQNKKIIKLEDMLSPSGKVSTNK